MDGDDENDDDNDRYNNNNNYSRSTPKPRRKQNKKTKFANDDDDNGDETAPAPPPRIPYDNRNLRFARSIDRNDGTSFDYVSTQEAKKYMPQNALEELDDTSCAELEDAQFAIYDKNNHHSHNDDDSDHENADQQQDVYYSDNNSARENLFASSESESSTARRQQHDNENHRPRERDEDSSSSSSFQNENRRHYEDNRAILNIPTTNNLDEIERSRRHGSTFDQSQNRHRRAKFCFGCSWQDPNKINTDSNAVSHMMKTMYYYFGQIRTRELAKIIHKQFMKTVYHPFIENQERQRREDEYEELPPREPIHMDIWRTKEIYQHLRSHVKDPRFFIHNKMEQLEEDYETLAPMTYCYVRDNNGNEYLRPDHQIIKTRMDIDKRMIELYNLKPKQMNFYNERLPVNIDLSGSVMNLHKNLSIQEREY